MTITLITDNPDMMIMINLTVSNKVIAINHHFTPTEPIVCDHLISGVSLDSITQIKLLLRYSCIIN